jgi:hypothetical protein
VHGLDWLLLAALVLDALQLAAALVAVAQGRRRRARGEHLLADYSFRHAGLLAAGAIVLAVPLVLGLAGVIADANAILLAVLFELVAVVVARPVLVRLHRAATG